MPGVQGMDLLRQIVNADPTIDVILMTGYYSTESAVEAIQAGAADYFPKPFSIDKLRKRIGQLLDDAKRRQCASGRKILPKTSGLKRMIGRSPKCSAFRKIRRIGPDSC